MEFLLRAFKKTRRRIRLEQLLLLLLRILAILLFVLALADPILESRAFGGAPGGRREVVLIVDDSFSMGLRGPDGSTEMARVLEQARDLVGGLQTARGDTVTLITAGRPAALRFRSTPELDRVRNELDELERGDGGTQLADALSIATGVVGELDPGAEIYLLSDLQRQAMNPAPAEEVAAETGVETTESGPTGGDVVAARLRELATAGRLTVLAPRDIPTDNVAVTAITPASKTPIVGAPTRVQVIVENFGSRQQGGRVDFYVDGATDPVDFRVLDLLPPGEALIVDFHHAFRTPGSHVVEARFSDDSLGVDNRRALALEVRGALDTLIIDGDPQPEPGEEESFFLAAALDPGGDDNAVRPFQVKVIEETAFERAELADVDLLVLMNVRLISPRGAERIRRYVREGGGLFVTLGDKVDLEAMNDLFWRGGSGIFPAELEEVGGEEEGSIFSYALEVEEFDHPILEYFEDPAVRPWLAQPPFYRFVRVEVPEGDSSVRTLAEFVRQRADTPDQTPALVERIVEKGKVLLFTSSGDAAWTDMPVLPTYLLLMREIAHHLTQRQSRLENLIVGQRYQRTLRGVARGATLFHDGEARGELVALAPEEGEALELRTDPLEEAGVWRLDLDGQNQAEARDPNPIHVAVNTDPEESDLTRVEPDWIARSLPGVDVAVVQDLDEAADAEGRTGSGHLWWWALLLAGAVLLLETLLAQLFGARRQAKGEVA